MPINHLTNQEIIDQYLHCTRDHNTGIHPYWTVGFSEMQRLWLVFEYVHFRFLKKAGHEFGGAAAQIAFATAVGAISGSVMGGPPGALTGAVTGAAYRTFLEIWNPIIQTPLTKSLRQNVLSTNKEFLENNNYRDFDYYTFYKWKGYYDNNIPANSKAQVLGQSDYNLLQHTKGGPKPNLKALQSHHPDLAGYDLDPHDPFFILKDRLFFKPPKSGSLNEQPFTYRDIFTIGFANQSPQTLPETSDANVEYRKIHWNELKPHSLKKFDHIWEVSKFWPMLDYLYFNQSLYAELHKYKESLLVADNKSTQKDQLKYFYYGSRYYYLSKNFYLDHFFENILPEYELVLSRPDNIPTGFRLFEKFFLKIKAKIPGHFDVWQNLAFNNQFITKILSFAFPHFEGFPTQMSFHIQSLIRNIFMGIMTTEYAETDVNTEMTPEEIFALEENERQYSALNLKYVSTDHEACIKKAQAKLILQKRREIITHRQIAASPKIVQTKPYLSRLWPYIVLRARFESTGPSAVNNHALPLLIEALPKIPADIMDKIFKVAIEKGMKSALDGSSDAVGGKFLKNVTDELDKFANTRPYARRLRQGGEYALNVLGALRITGGTMNFITKTCAEKSFFELVLGKGQLASSFTTSFVGTNILNVLFACGVSYTKDCLYSKMDSDCLSKIHKLVCDDDSLNECPGLKSPFSSSFRSLSHVASIPKGLSSKDLSSSSDALSHETHSSSSSSSSSSGGGRTNFSSDILLSGQSSSSSSSGSSSRNVRLDLSSDLPSSSSSASSSGFVHTSISKFEPTKRHPVVVDYGSTHPATFTHHTAENTEEIAYGINCAFDAKILQDSGINFQKSNLLLYGVNIEHPVCMGHSIPFNGTGPLYLKPSYALYHSTHAKTDLADSTTRVFTHRLTFHGAPLLSGTNILQYAVNVTNLFSRIITDYKYKPRPAGQDLYLSFLSDFYKDAKAKEIGAFLPAVFGEGHEAHLFSNTNDNIPTIEQCVQMAGLWYHTAYCAFALLDLEKKIDGYSKEKSGDIEFLSIFDAFVSFFQKFRESSSVIETENRVKYKEFDKFPDYVKTQSIYIRLLYLSGAFLYRNWLNEYARSYHCDPTDQTQTQDQNLLITEILTSQMNQVFHRDYPVVIIAVSQQQEANDIQYSVSHYDALFTQEDNLYSSASKLKDHFEQKFFPTNPNLSTEKTFNDFSNLKLGFKFLKDPKLFTKEEKLALYIDFGRVLRHLWNNVPLPSKISSLKKKVEGLIDKVSKQDFSEFDVGSSKSFNKSGTVSDFVNAYFEYFHAINRIHLFIYYSRLYKFVQESVRVEFLSLTAQMNADLRETLSQHPHHEKDLDLLLNQLENDLTLFQSSTMPNTPHRPMLVSAPIQIKGKSQKPRKYGTPTAPFSMMGEAGDLQRWGSFVRDRQDD